jgi:hypothetical protein
MTKRITVSFLFLLFLISSFQCKKENNGRLRGILIDEVCGNTIIKITSGDYDPSLVVDSWQDPQTGNTYEKVFAVSNYCQVQGRLTPGQIFDFNFSTSLPQNCVRCLGLRAVPPKFNAIHITTIYD